MVESTFPVCDAVLSDVLAIESWRSFEFSTVGYVSGASWSVPLVDAPSHEGLGGRDQSNVLCDSNSLLVGIVCTIVSSFNFVGTLGFVLITSWLEDTASTYAHKNELGLSYQAKNKLQVRYLPLILAPDTNLFEIHSIITVTGKHSSCSR